MKKMLMFGLYGLLILGASAGATWFLRSKDIAEQEAASQPTDPLTQSTAALAAPVDVTRPLPDATENVLPVAVRPGEMSVEEIVRYGLGHHTVAKCVEPSFDSVQTNSRRGRQDAATRSQSAHANYCRGAAMDLKDTQTTDGFCHTASTESLTLNSRERTRSSSTAMRPAVFRRTIPSCTAVV